MVTLSMSRKELSRVEWLCRVKRGETSLRAASDMMQVSYRQVKRLCQHYQAQGESGLVHCFHGKNSNRKVDDAFCWRVVQLCQENYPDFGVTLASECLLEEDKIDVPVETLRSS